MLERINKDTSLKVQQVALNTNEKVSSLCLKIEGTSRQLDLVEQKLRIVQENFYSLSFSVTKKLKETEERILRLEHVMKPQNLANLSLQNQYTNLDMRLLHIEDLINEIEANREEQTDLVINSITETVRHFSESNPAKEEQIEVFKNIVALNKFKINN